MQRLQGARPEHVVPPAVVSDAAQPLLHCLLDTNMRAWFHARMTAAAVVLQHSVHVYVST